MLHVAAAMDKHQRGEAQTYHVNVSMPAFSGSG
jgi:hypothetical protein